ncbi:MAG: DUF4410 domain-containing protein [Bacteroidales bacterium]|nr:DUF4410 domain-containing protein [Bacteroidales bacterium]
MKNLTRLVAAFAFLTLSSAGLKAQQTLKDWEGIDQITIYHAIPSSQIGNLYILPADESVCEFHDKQEKVNKQVADQMAAFRPMIKKTCKKVKVQLVDSVPANLGANDLVMSIKYVAFDLGNRAARVWGGFGAGHAQTTLNITVKDAKGNMVFEAVQEHLSGGNPFADMRYHKVLGDMHKNFAKDIANIFAGMDDMK